MPSISKPFVLVVDPNTVTLSASLSLMHCHDFACRGAQKPDEALSIACQQPIDLIISEFALGAIDGCSLVEGVREVPHCVDVPAVFLNAGQIPDVIRRSHGSWSAYHLRKPVDPQVLIEVVDLAMCMPHVVRARINQPHFSIDRIARGAASDEPVPQRAWLRK